MRILVTGASGCVGHYVSETLIQNTDHELFLCVRNPAKLNLDLAARPGIHVITVDMMEIEKQAVPQEKDPIEAEQEVQENLDDEEYYEQFIEKFTKPQAPIKEAENKPEVLYNDDNDLAWDMLLEEDEGEAFLKKVKIT